MIIGGNSTRAFYERARMSMSGVRSETERLQVQLATGNRIERSSDDPIAASRLRSLSRAERLSEVDELKTNRASADLSLADVALQDISDLVSRVRELAIQAGSETISVEQRKVIGLEVGEIHTQLLTLANARDMGGHALFGGEASTQAYGTDGAGNPVYLGNGTAGQLDLGEGQSVTRSITGPEIFDFAVGGTPMNLLQVVKDLSLALGGGVADPAAAARDALAPLGAGLDNVTTNQTVLGARLVWLEFVTSRGDQLGELRAEEQREVGAADIAETVTKLQQMMTTLEASQASFTKVQSLSLFNHIR